MKLGAKVKFSTGVRTSLHFFSIPTAVCDTPPLPLNGRVMDNYTSTVEGSTLTITCDRQSRSGSPVTSVCTQLGIWQPNPVDICTQLSSGIISTGIYPHICACNSGMFIS